MKKILLSIAMSTILIGTSAQVFATSSSTRGIASGTAINGHATLIDKNGFIGYRVNGVDNNEYASSGSGSTSNIPTTKSPGQVSNPGSNAEYYDYSNYTPGQGIAPIDQYTQGLNDGMEPTFEQNEMFLYPPTKEDIDKYLKKSTEFQAEKERIQKLFHEDLEGVHSEIAYLDQQRANMSPKQFDTHMTQMQQLLNDIKKNKESALNDARAKFSPKFYDGQKVNNPALYWQGKEVTQDTVISSSNQRDQNAHGSDLKKATANYNADLRMIEQQYKEFEKRRGNMSKKDIANWMTEYNQAVSYMKKRHQQHIAQISDQYTPATQNRVYR